MAYTPPAGDAADLTLVGAAAYTAPAGDAADLTFAESGGTPSVSLTLAVFPPYFPVQPEAAVFSLLAYAASITISDVSIYPPAALLALDAYAPLTDGVLVPGPPIYALTASIPSLVQPNSWEIALESAIEFRHVTHLPWIMPMTSPVYPPATTLTLDVPVPGVNIHGLWSPEAMLFGWEYDSGTDTISIPLATLFELTASQANATTGDWRAVVLALVNSMWDSYVELDSPPRAMVLEYYPGYMMNVGPFTGHVKVDYQATTYLNFPDKTLADEP